MATKYPNSGMLGKAKQPKINPNSPDYTGSIDVDISLIKEMLEDARQEGADSINMKIGAWIKEGQYGKFFSIKVNNYKKTAAAPQQRAIPEDDSDIPF
jgi:hypothetical protein